MNISTVPILDETRARTIAANIHSQHENLDVPMHKQIEATLAQYKNDSAARDLALQQLFTKNPEKLAGFHPHEHLSEQITSRHENPEYGMREETFTATEFAKFFESDMCLAQFGKILSRILEEAEARPHDTTKRLEDLDQAVSKMHSMAHIASHMGLAVHPDISQTMLDLRSRIQAAQGEHTAKTAPAATATSDQHAEPKSIFETDEYRGAPPSVPNATTALAAKGGQDAANSDRHYPHTDISRLIPPRT